MEGRREAGILNRGAFPDGKVLTSSDRVALLNSYLPQPRPSTSIDAHPLGRSIRAQNAAANQQIKHKHLAQLHDLVNLFIYKLLFLAIQFAFSLYIRARQAYHAVLYRLFAILYYHHRTPELIKRDVKKLSRLPKHLSVIVDYEGEEDRAARRPESLRKLVDEVGELCAWSACVGIPVLSVYERTGVLKSHIPSLHKSILTTFRAYFPPTSLPAFRLRVPNFPNYSPPSSPTNPSSPTTYQDPSPLTLILLSASDGRETLVDLTKTLTEMSQRGKLCPEDISAELIDAELTDSSCGEPDLLILMTPPSQRVGKTGEKRGLRGAAGTAGADVCLRGYPPWQVRLTEIFYVKDNAGMDYQVFLRALHNYAKAQMKFGR